MGEHKIKEARERKFQRHMQVMGIVWSMCATLPIFETLVFNAHVSTGRSRLSTETYFQLGGFFIVLWASMCFVFLVEKKQASSAWSSIKEEIRSSLYYFKNHKLAAIVLATVLFLTFVFGGWKKLLESIKSTATENLQAEALILSIAVVLWVVYRLLTSMGESLPKGSREGVESWAVGLVLSIVFYGFLIVGTFSWVNFKGMSSGTWFAMAEALSKDYALLFLISCLLYVGLFKLARHRALADVFQNVRGYIHFVVICALIAVFAVWADYNGLDRPRLEHLFNNEWQRQYMEAHVFIRDIGLLLFPIGWLLFWTIWCFSHEKQQHNTTTPSAAAQPHNPE